MAQRPRVVAFDLVETIAGLDPVAERMVGAGLSSEMLPLWFTQVMQDGFALTICDEYRPFATVASEALAPLLQQAGVAPLPATIQGILSGFAELPALPDLLPALLTLKDAGVRMIILANGSAASASCFVERNGLDGLIERVASVDEANHWKPHAAAYQYASNLMQVTTEQMALVTAHGWDVLGAGHAGMGTGWINRREQPPAAALGQPTVTGATLSVVVEALLALA